MKKHGLILIDKPESLTSFAALGHIKRTLQTRKIGHTGTLDPFATGLMVVLAGSYTRLADHITGFDKRYLATVRFGVATDTLDADGKQTACCSAPEADRLRAVLPQFIGRIEQQPPIYSALKVGGKRAHRLARAGVTLEMARRPVEIFDLVLKHYDPPTALFEVYCGKGTYIRSLARDIAQACGSCAHVSGLRRTAVGPFAVAEAVSPQQFDPGLHLWSADRFIDRVPGIQVVTLSGAAVERVRHGGAIGDSDVVSRDLVPGACALMDTERNLLALADYDGAGFRYRCVLAAAG